jgi:hypothetical protein
MTDTLLHLLSAEYTEAWSLHACRGAASMVPLITRRFAVALSTAYSVRSLRAAAEWNGFDLLAGR